SVQLQFANGETASLTDNRLRVFRSAHTAHLGRGVGQERWWCVGPSEKYAARCGSMWDEMRMRTACFARAPQRCTSRLSKHFLLTFQEVTPLSKTCNQLYVKTLDICRQTVQCCLSSSELNGFLAPFGDV